MPSIPDWWKRPRKIAVVVDTPGWFDRHAEDLVAAIEKDGDRAAFLRRHEDVGHVDIAFYLSCMRIVPAASLAKARVNLVAHASDLPKGRGFSPIVWQILDGACTIPICLIHAAEPVDSGDIVLSHSISFEGHELNDEIRNVLGRAIADMCLTYLHSDAPPESRPQHGEATWYSRRTPKNSRLDPHKTIAMQFDLLRVVDNDRYPAFFDLRGHRYIVRIEPAPGDNADSAPRKCDDQNE